VQAAQGISLRIAVQTDGSHDATSQIGKIPAAERDHTLGPRCKKSMGDAGTHESGGTRNQNGHRLSMDE
jgi:hypothetical protein